MQKWLKILLIIVVAIVVLFVVLQVIIVMIAAPVLLINPTQIGTDGCVGFQKLPIRNMQISNSGMQIQITNMTGRSLDDVYFKARFDDGSYIDSIQYNGDDELGANDEVAVSWTGQNLFSGSHTVDLEVSYNDGEFPKNATASCKLTVG